MDSEIEELKQKVQALENTLNQLTNKISLSDKNEIAITAPLRVLDFDGRAILEVRAERNDRGIKIFSEQGESVTSLGADGTHCGYLAIRNANGTLVGYITVENAGAKLEILDHERKGGVVLYTDDIDGGGIIVLHRSGNRSVSIESDRSVGLIEVYDIARDEPAAKMPS